MERRTALCSRGLAVWQPASNAVPSDRHLLVFTPLRGALPYATRVSLCDPQYSRTNGVSFLGLAYKRYCSVRAGVLGSLITRCQVLRKGPGGRSRGLGQSVSRERSLLLTDVNEPGSGSSLPATPSGEDSPG